MEQVSQVLRGQIIEGKNEKQHNKVNYNSLNELLQKHILPFEVTL